MTDTSTAPEELAPPADSLADTPRERPGVVVVTRTKDRAVLLGRALDSVLGQTWNDWHLVVVNDGGDPAPVDALVAARADAFAGRVTVLHHPASLGMEAASNRGLRAVSGRYVAIHDDDDSWDPAFLERMVGFLEESEGRFAGAVCRVERVLEEIDGETVRETGRESFNEPFGQYKLTVSYISSHNQFPPIAFLYRREVLDEIGFYREDLPVLGDWEFNLRFVARHAIGLVDEVLAHWHIREGAGPQASSVTGLRELHLRTDTLLRSELLRRDLTGHQLGLGLLTNLKMLLDDSDRFLNELRRQHENHLAEIARQHDGHQFEIASQRQERTEERAQVVAREEWRQKMWAEDRIFFSGELRRQNDRVACLEAREAEAQAALAAARGELAALRASTSWKLTVPVRLAGRLARRLARLGYPGGLRAQADALREMLPIVLVAARRGPRGARHFLRGVQAIRHQHLFDRDFYLGSYPDVARAGFNPLLHYLRFGTAEGRKPLPWFDGQAYLAANPDVVAAGVEPLTHYALFGRAEGRPLAPPPAVVLEERYELAERWYDEEAPEVSIVILNFNKAHLTEMCLDSLWRYTKGHSYEIVVVDNGSQIPDFEILSKIPGRWRLIRLEANRFFGEGNNIGAEAARGRTLCFMNNDVTVTPNWLEPLMEMFDSHVDCGAVGPKFVYPNGVLQEAGALLKEDGCAEQLGKGGDPADPRFNNTRAVDYVSAATVLMRRETFERVLGFDLTWEPAYYEDSDLCLKIALLGLRTYYCPSVTVIHHENATSSDPSHGLKLNNIVDINRIKFLDRWGAWLKNGRTEAPLEVLPPTVAAAPRGPATLVLYTPYSVIPGGGERYLLTIAEALKDTHRAYLVTPERYSTLRLRTVARDLDLDIGHVQPIPAYEMRQLAGADLAVVMGNEVLPPIPGPARRNIFHCQFPFPLDRHEAARRWSWWDEYECLVVNSEFTRDHLRVRMGALHVPGKPIEIVYPPVEMHGEADQPPAAKDRIILSVGRFFTGGHCKRQDTMIEAFRAMYEAGERDAELHLVGALHPEAVHRDYFLHCQRLAQGLPVVFHLNAAPATLRDLYRRAACYWHATGLNVDTDTMPEKAEHFGMSIVEAMSAGCVPVVVNKGGPAYIVQHGATGFRFDTPAELAFQTRRVLAELDQPWVAEMRLQVARRAQTFSKRAAARHWRRLAGVPEMESVDVVTA